MGDRRVSSVALQRLVDGQRSQPYFESEAEAGVIFPRRAVMVDEVVAGIIYLVEASMMNDFELRIDGGTRGSSNWGGAKDRSYCPV